MFPILAFQFELFLTFLVWAVMLVLNLWMWQKTKANGNLLMLVGAGCLGLASMLLSFGTAGEFLHTWLPLIGAVLVVTGFYYTAKPIVDVHIQALKKKLADATSEKKDGAVEEKTEEKTEEAAEE